MAKMKVAVVTKPGADFEIQEREIPQPGFGEVRIKVQACGVCHSDFVTKEGLWPGIVYPRIPGHEVAGVVDEVGAGVTEWKKVTAWGRAGTEGTTLYANRAVEETLLLARIKQSQVLRATEDIRSTCWQGMKRWLGFRTISRPQKRDR